MNDDQITQSVNNLVNQAGDPSASVPTPNFGLGTNPSAMQMPSPPPEPKDTETPPDQPQIDTTQNIDHSSDIPAIQNDNDSAETELESIRKDALNQLSPLLGKLEQSPEEKYRTLMMMIQASDDKSLVRAAYDAANQIEDDSKKAEALLGIVNEINYFSKKNEQTSSS